MIERGYHRCKDDYQPFVKSADVPQRVEKSVRFPDELSVFLLQIDADPKESQTVTYGSLGFILDNYVVERLMLISFPDTMHIVLQMEFVRNDE